MISKDRPGLLRRRVGCPVIALYGHRSDDLSLDDLWIPPLKIDAHIRFWEMYIFKI
jgi:hypothetical protein